MRQLNDSEKRTVRIAGILVGIYLVLFGGYLVRKQLEKQRGDYKVLLAEADKLKHQLEPYKDKADRAGVWMEEFHLDPARLAKLPRATIVAEANAAIQRAATTGGIQLGPVRESFGHGSGREIATMRLEGSGQVAAVTSLLHRMGTLGYPVVIDSVDLTLEPSRPGQVKVTMTLIILDFEQWKTETTPHA